MLGWFGQELRSSLGPNESAHVGILDPSFTFKLSKLASWPALVAQLDLINHTL
jgi:hypothetical protein